jgi:hypothetical protein
VPSIQTMTVNGVIPADLLISEGDGPTLLVNTDLTNNLYLSHSNSPVAGDPRMAVILSPQSYIVFDGTEDVYGITLPGVNIQVQIIPGGVSYFQSGITSGGLIVNNAGLFFYNGTPRLGNLMFSIAATAGTDPYGNIYPAGIETQQSPGGFFVYNGTPGSGKLAVAIAPQSGTDPFGNAYPVGISLAQNPGGLFVYNGAPGSGKLALAIAPAAGTDAYGNTYPLGLSIGYAAPFVYIHSVPGSGGFGIVEFPTKYSSGGVLEKVISSIQGAIVENSPGAHHFLQLLATGPSISLSGHDDYVYTEWNSANEDASGFANLEFIYNTISSGSGGQEYAFMDGSGFNINTGFVHAADPTTGTSPANPAASETWHTVTVDSGWTVGRTLRYQRLAQRNMVYVEGALTHAAFTGATNINSSNPLPAQYRPTGSINIGGPGIPNRAGAEITSGGVFVAEANGVSCTEIDLNGIYPLD